MGRQQVRPIGPSAVHDLRLADRRGCLCRSGRAETVTRFSRNGIPIRDVPVNPFEIDWSPDGSHVVVFGFDQVGPFLVSL
jgi:hypothetical protein